MVVPILISESTLHAILLFVVISEETPHTTVKGRILRGLEVMEIR